MSVEKVQDAIVIGGGFYGAAIAIYLVKNRGLKSVTLIEQEDSLLVRASYNNQARVHNGYHYPRSFTTAYRSRINFPKFVRDWPEIVKRDFVKLYAIARRNSKVTANQFERFYRDIGAKLELASPAYRNLFNSRLIEQVYLVEEYAFDTTLLAKWASHELQAAGVNVLLKTKAVSISNRVDKLLGVNFVREGEAGMQLNTHYLFNCTYSGLNQFEGDFPRTCVDLKQEITEMALMRVAPELEQLGITVMDGPFFSIMPFPARGLHTVSHVRYTPHQQWVDAPGVNPYERLKDYPRDSRIDRMVRDISRYLPSMQNSEYVDSLYEVKTILVKNEGDDGRPILLEKHERMPRCYSILGGKIDNIYDVLEKLEAEDISVPENSPG